MEKAWKKIPGFIPRSFAGIQTGSKHLGSRLSFTGVTATVIRGELFRVFQTG
jgi:hypothetical protein